MLSSPEPHPPSPAGLQARPFRAVTYREHDPDHLARVSSPAYDLITPAERKRLAAADPHNIVRLILPGVDPAPSGGGTEAEGAGPGVAETLLRRWLDAGVLVRDDDPGLWLYQLRPGAGAPTTTGWLAAVTLPPPGSPVVLPHEETFPPAVVDRRELLAATRADLEPIVLAHDPAPQLTELAEEVSRVEPTLEVTDTDGVRHRLWRVSDPGRIARITTALAGTRALIADGHHRYAAAQSHHAACPEAPGSGAILALLTPFGPTGLRLQAIHRVVPGLDLDTAAAAAARGFTVTELPPPGPGGGLLEAAEAWVGSAGQGEFLLSDGGRLLRLAAPSSEVRARVVGSVPANLRSLDVVLAEYGLLQELWRRGENPEDLVLAHDVAEALERASRTRGVAVLLRPPAAAEVAAVARAGARMPRKSTLFVPKPRTGLVLRPHAG